MILTNVYTHTNEDHDLYLVFEFDDGRLEFECPVGMTAPEALLAFRAFVNKAELLISEDQIVH